MKLGIIFGGSGSERYVSVVSATSIITNLNKDKYQIYPIYLDGTNKWYQVNDKITSICELGYLPKHIKKINNPIKYLKKLDIVFPCIHGKIGEDGKIEGLFELLNIPYVGSQIFSSSLAYDKVYTKRLLASSGISVVRDIVLKKKNSGYILVDENFKEHIIDINYLYVLVAKKLGYPIFVKPAREGSSVGVIKVENENNLKEAIKKSFKYDNKILLEEAINARELECAILNDKALEVGEIISNENFYSYSSKYINKKSYTIVPANISKKLRKEVLNISKQAFKVIDGKNLARIDFFYDMENNKLYLNEINTMPGFTTISMYPKLAISTGITYAELLDTLISSAI